MYSTYLTALLQPISTRDLHDLSPNMNVSLKQPGKPLYMATRRRVQAPLIQMCNIPIRASESPCPYRRNTHTLYFLTSIVVPTTGSDITNSGHLFHSNPIITLFFLQMTNRILLHVVNTIIEDILGIGLCMAI